MKRDTVYSPGAKDNRFALLGVHATQSRCVTLPQLVTEEAQPREQNIEN